jgi:hypothetical protein
MMRTLKTQTVLPALLCGAALLSFACSRGTDDTGQATTETTSSQTAQAPAPVATPPPANELRPEPQSVQIQ